MKTKFMLFFIFIILLSACTAEPQARITEIVQVFVTATPSSTVPPSRTPSPTLTPTPTPTPTPTALPAEISGNPRAYQRLDPVPAYGAACGFVDTLDFPLNPPNGENTRGGSDFGTFRSRYDKYHAGEDWGFTNQSNFGEPVYSIGHGQVTLAAPNGWGPDKGTVVVRHVFEDGGYILSFYGHLDPPSVTLKIGDCVQRGDKIGDIGRPRTPPHLHFEIRLHLPGSTGAGYWSVDPTLAGWLPPSQTIHEVRMQTSPGVAWTRPYEEKIVGLGLVEEAYWLVSDQNLIAITPETGAAKSLVQFSETTATVALDLQIPQIYLYDTTGKISAYTLPPNQDLNWRINTNTYSNAQLIPMPDGGIIVTDRKNTIGISPEGEKIWEVTVDAELTGWIFMDETFIFSTRNAASALWSVANGQPIQWDWDQPGKLIQADERVFLYTEDGVYQLDPQNHALSAWLPLPKGRLTSGDIAANPAGGLLISHVDGDHRILAVDQGGAIVWERSIRGQIEGTVQFVRFGDQIYLAAIDNPSQGLEFRLYAINFAADTLTHIFTGGSRSRYARSSWVTPLNENLLLINVGGGASAALNPAQAIEIITGP